MSTVTLNKTVRTAAEARAERAARTARVRPITDADTDALLPVYDVSDAYPALSSRTISRREERDNFRRALTVADFSELPGNTQQSDTHNVNDANFNRAAPAVGLSRAAMDAMTAREIDRILAALDLSAEMDVIVRLRLDDWSLQQIGDHLGENKQTIARRIDSVGKKLALFWYTDKKCGLDEVYQSIALRHIHHELTGGRPAVPASVCQCASHQFRVQRVKGQEGVNTYHCTNCRAKYDKPGFDALRQGAA
ncbi:MAG: hypothetical protein ACRYFS_24480 [Janthinobacterium lividum]